MSARTSAAPRTSTPRSAPKTRCTLTGGDDPTEYGVSIKVTEVDGDNAKFDIQVDEKPQG